MQFISAKHALKAQAHVLEYV